MALRSEQMLARYNQWANEVVYQAAAGLPEGAVAAPCKTTFGRILHTLGHNYAVGAIFQAHLQGRPHEFAVRQLPSLPALGELRGMQRELDVWYMAWIDGNSDSALDERIRFQFVDGGTGVMSRREILFHVVNHYTFHRGFVVDSLRRMSLAVPATDLTVYLCEYIARH